MLTKNALKLIHKPVLLDAVINSLAIQPDDIVLDGTIGFGGHSSAIYQQLGENGKLIGLDQDPVPYQYNLKQFDDKPNVFLFQKNYQYFADCLAEIGIDKINKVLIDLGISSFQIDSSNRGFTYQKEEPLDMRMDPLNNSLTAEKIINNYEEEDLFRIFFDFGEIKKPEKLVENIIIKRKLEPVLSTKNLVDIIKKSFFFRNSHKLYFRTLSQVFQALRIEVNQELKVLENFLENIINYLEPNARIAIITFHSLEDKIVKQFAKEHSNVLEPVNKKVIKPKYEEVRLNSRARSAKLRILRCV